MGILKFVVMGMIATMNQAEARFAGEQVDISVKDVRLVGFNRGPGVLAELHHSLGRKAQDAGLSLIDAEKSIYKVKVFGTPQLCKALVDGQTDQVVAALGDNLQEALKERRGLSAGNPILSVRYDDRAMGVILKVSASQVVDLQNLCTPFVSSLKSN